MKVEKLHKSAYISGSKFFARYATRKSASILEIGSYDVNGTLRDFQPEGSTWIGADIESGPGVDLVIENTSSLPFEDSSFDYVVASSVFEHDPTFWSTFGEMVRVLKTGGCIYVNSPSNGMIHLYPIDVYRFYPDAGKALEKWGKTFRPDLKLAESFIGKHDDFPWNDFCAVFVVGECHANQTIYSDTQCENVWHGDQFLEETFAEFPQDQRRVVELQTQHSELQTQHSELQTQFSIIVNSKSWKITRPLRKLMTWFSK